MAAGGVAMVMMVMMMVVVDNVRSDILFNLGKRTSLKSGIKASIGRKKKFRPKQDSKGIKQRKFRKSIV